MENSASQNSRELYCSNDKDRPLSTGKKSDADSPRSEFRRDFSRLIHSPAFRRLQGKTQLFPGNDSDFFRNRLTHSLEVAQVAKSIATRFNHNHPFFRSGNLIDTDLVELAGLAHDLEDSLKAGFVSPLDLISPPHKVVAYAATAVSKAMGYPVPDKEVHRTLVRLVARLLVPSEAKAHNENDLLKLMANAVQVSRELQRDGYARTGFTSELVDRFISGVDAKPHNECPPLSRIDIRDEVKLEIEVLKNFTFAFTIMSPRVRLTSYRGQEIVTSIFNALSDKDRHGHELLPDDISEFWESAVEEDRPRVICDFVAGMTDNYAAEFYARLTSDAPRSIFKPH